MLQHTLEKTYAFSQQFVSKLVVVTQGNTKHDCHHIFQYF